MVYKSNRFTSTGVLSFRPFFKPANVVRYLHSSSFHHPSVHLSWPRSQASRLKPLSSSRSIFAQANHQMRVRMLSDVVTVEKGNAIQPKRSAISRVRVIVPYHPVFVNELSRFLSEFNSRWCVHTNVVAAFGYSLLTRNVSSHLRSTYRVWAGGGGRSCCFFVYWFKIIIPSSQQQVFWVERGQMRFNCRSLFWLQGCAYSAQGVIDNVVRVILA